MTTPRGSRRDHPRHSDTLVRRLRAIGLVVGMIAMLAGCGADANSGAGGDGAALAGSSTAGPSGGPTGSRSPLPRPTVSTTQSASHTAAHTTTQTATRTATRTATATFTSVQTATARTTATIVVSSPPGAGATAVTAATLSTYATDAPPVVGWWVLAFAAGGLIAGLWLWIRSRRSRRVWEAAFVAASDEASWVAIELMPGLLASAPDARRGGWAVARGRVLALEAHLDRLDSTAHTDLDRHRVVTLRSAVVAVRTAFDSDAMLTGSYHPDAAGALLQVQRRLEEALTIARQGQGGDLAVRAES